MAQLSLNEEQTPVISNDPIEVEQTIVEEPIADSPLVNENATTTSNIV